MLTLDLELPGKILVIDGDPPIRTLLARCFGHASEVIQAADGVEGYEKFLREAPDFVVLDLMVGGLDGLSFIRKARRSHLGACVPILVLTVSSGEQALIECFYQGADDFMVKPFSLSELRVRVSSIFLRQRVARDANPLTRLPGNAVIKQQIVQRLAEPEPFLVAVLDLDHFKAFNDTRGYDAGDAVIRGLGDILTRYAVEQPELFVGHIGGDDFVVILPMNPDGVQAFSDYVHAEMQRLAADYYAPEEIERGWVEIYNRNGEFERVPLLSVSIGVVSTEREGLEDYRFMAQALAEVKKVAKSQAGNSLFVDRRRTPTSGAQLVEGEQPTGDPPKSA